MLEGLKSVFARIDQVDASLGGTGVKISFKDVLKNEITEDNWFGKGLDVINAIKRMSDQKPILIIIDELSECVSNMIREGEGTKKFLQWFRSVRQKNTEELRFLVGGSVSISQVVKEINGLAEINDLTPLNISGFSKKDSLEFIKSFVEEEGLEYREELGEKILECVGEEYIPYFLSIVLSTVIQEWEEDSDIDLVDELYSSTILGNHGKGYFEYYKQRLRLHYKEYAKAAEEILKNACIKEEGYPRDYAFSLFERTTGENDYEKFLDLLFDLENDFYIKIENKNIKFKSKVLRDWWRLYYA